MPLLQLIHYCLQFKYIGFWRRGVIFQVVVEKELGIHLNLIELGSSRQKDGQNTIRSGNRWGAQVCRVLLQHYMNKKVTIDTLASQGNIVPAFTRTVWEKLEQDNQEFFKAYNVRLLVKDQIMAFNRLLSKQVELMHQHGNVEINNGLNSAGSHVSTRQISTPSAAPSSTEDMQQQLNVFNHNGSSIQQCLQGNFGWSLHGREIGVSPNMVLAQRMNGHLVETRIGYAGTSTLNFSSPRNFLESLPLMGDKVESNTEHPDNFLLDSEEDAELAADSSSTDYNFSNIL